MGTDANAPGARPTMGHIRGLDGIRALSVLAIIAFHTGLNSVPGGFYGVDSFFINVRCTDGVHFTRSGGIYIGQRLAPELAALGQAHAGASPGGGWPGPLPPSTPSWITNLPCR